MLLLNAQTHTHTQTRTHTHTHTHRQNAEVQQAESFAKCANVQSAEFGRSKNARATMPHRAHAPATLAKIILYLVGTKDISN